MPTAVDPNECFVQSVVGRLVYPPYAPAPSHNMIHVDLKPVAIYGQERATIVSVSNTFEFRDVMAANYDIVITAEGMDTVRQQLVVNHADCGAGAPLRVDVQMKISPAFKSFMPESAVSIDSLMRKTPDAVVKLFEKVVDSEAKSDPKNVTSALVDVLKKAPDYYDANLKLGYVYRKNLQPNQAALALIRALELNPASMHARSALGQYTFEAGDFERTADLLGGATRLGSTSAEVYFMLGTSYYRLKRLDLAEASLLRALVIDSNMGKAYLQLYNVYLLMGEPEKALKEADTYLDKFRDAADRESLQIQAEKLRKLIKPF